MGEGGGCVRGWEVLMYMEVRCHTLAGSGKCAGVKWPLKENPTPLFPGLPNFSTLPQNCSERTLHCSTNTLLNQIYNDIFLSDIQHLKLSKVA